MAHLVAYALDMAGQPDVTRNFYEFCKDVLLARRLSAYTNTIPDKSLGSSWHPWTDVEGNPQLPIQEDETALVIWALWEHYQRFRDVEFIRPLYSPSNTPGRRLYGVLSRKAHTGPA